MNTGREINKTFFTLIDTPRCIFPGLEAEEKYRE